LPSELGRTGLAGCFGYFGVSGFSGESGAGSVPVGEFFWQAVSVQSKEREAEGAKVHWPSVRDRNRPSSERGHDERITWLQLAARAG
jgi:hypothetical protein